MMPFSAMALRTNAPPNTAFADAVTTDAPYLWWRLGEASGVTVADSSGNGRGGTVSGTSGTSYDRGVAGLVGDSNLATRLKQNSGALQSAAAISASLLATSKTLALAVRIDSGAGAGTILGLNDGISPTGTSGSRDRVLYVNTAGKLVAGIYSAAVRTIVSTASINDGQKHLIHLAMGANNTEGSELYIDGVSVGTIPYVSNDTSGTRYLYGGSLNLSGWPNGAAAAATAFGTYDEVLIFPTRLTAARILAQAQAGGFA
ncbi:LamG-like jellyroll fold domain-containing protein [Xanthomonas sp. NCPPB 3005]|uniref:LamG-like jellyroll fold domain-containing protein n=1 Tax=Xanthomonas sp. NCPPB 3005 TaxID=3240913 RepID=UPI0035136DD8